MQICITQNQAQGECFAELCRRMAFAWEVTRELFMLVVVFRITVLPPNYGISGGKDA